MKHLPALVGFFCLFVFVTFSNIFDWDHFLAAAEVDLRSWLIDFRPPLWSYQLCAGVTRLGDPQSFGLSILFLFPIIFGSFWGLKLMALFTAILGYLFTRQLLLYAVRKVWPLTQEHSNFEFHISLLSLSFVLGNYFLWHLHEGHLTFGITYVAFGIIYFSVRGMCERLSAKEMFLASLIVWVFFTSGFYHAFTFTLIPFYVAGTFVVLATLVIERNRSRLINVSQVVLFHLLGLLASSYKWWSVLKYQQEFPRSYADRPEEIGSLWKMLLYQFVPTIDHNYLGFISSKSILDAWGIWEYSAFNLVVWNFVIIGALVLFKRQKLASTQNEKYLYSGIGIYAGVVFLFCLGDAHSLLPFKLMNTYLLKDSVRVIGRYNIGLTIAVLFLTATMIRKYSQEHNNKISKVLLLGVFISIINMATFRESMFLSVFKDFQNASFDPLEKMQVVVKTPDRTTSQSFMFETIAQGSAAANCYMPLTRKEHFLKEFSDLPGGALLKFKFLDVDENSECFKNSYFTQSELVIDQSCPEGTVLNINQLNIYRPDSRFSLEGTKYVYRPQR